METQAQSATRVILVSTFSRLSDSQVGRLTFVYNRIKAEKLVITTDFSHGRKTYQPAAAAQSQNQRCLHVPPYHGNISLRRIWSHLVFAWRVWRFLNALDGKPKTVYCMMPTSSAAYVCARFCKRHHIKFVIDVIDLWPDSLIPLFKGKMPLKILLAPWTALTRYSYRHADVILGESLAYTNEAKRYNPRARAYPIYLGINVMLTERVKERNRVLLEKPEDEIWIAYAGSLGNSYDFRTLLDAVKNLQCVCQYKLWFIGDGTCRDEIESYSAQNSINMVITGFLPYEELLGYLCYMDIAVNIFRKDTKVVYSYKFNDYVGMGCFVLNSLEGETARLIDDYWVGRNFNYTDHPLAEVLSDTVSHWEYYSSFRKNTSRLIMEKLDADRIYSVVDAEFNDFISSENGKDI